MEGRRKDGRKDGWKEGRKDGRRGGRKEKRTCVKMCKNTHKYAKICKHMSICTQLQRCKNVHISVCSLICKNM
jgi:hypothetical protein